MKKAKLEPILHLNYISVNKFPPIRAVDIYCRAKNKVVSSNQLDSCWNCQYYRGSGQGTMLECEWDDEPPFYGKIRRIQCGDADKEFHRVNELIKAGVLK